MGSDTAGNKTNRQGAWITIGSFDGVHIGHQQIIKTLVEGAKTEKTSSVVVTFFPHPAKVLRTFPDPFYLSTPEEKDNALASLGLTSVLTIQFNRLLASLTAHKFMSILHNQLKFSCLLIGYDFRLGANREGDIHRLREIGEELGYCVRAIEPLQSTSQVVSSSLIRKLISDGDITNANTMLGRWHAASGEIVHGDGRGKHIGIPTANIEPWSEKLIPKIGVYATLAELNGRLYQAVVNIGRRPTFYSIPAQQTIEVHLLDFNRDIYGSHLCLNFIKRIRDEVKFNSAEELMRQIRKDITDSREVLEHATTEKNLSA
ncbi:MAG: bifunctional riboflavin kinase/FAD synthetase [Pelolinea sp.]|nr:bifunctional riboflavin kinase/FAD synthetase [Pelolinea sp.]